MTSILIKTFQGKIYFATLFSRIEYKTIYLLSLEAIIIYIM
jgi:hypothetical protein